MAFPITYEARQNGKLEMLVVASAKGKFSLYRPNGVEETEEDSPGIPTNMEVVEPPYWAP